MVNWWWRGTKALPLVLFLIAFLPRTTGLGSFTFPDESTWIERSINFIYGLTEHDLMATHQSDHPGVTAMWGYGLFLLSRFLVAGELPALYDMRGEDKLQGVPSLLAVAAPFNVLVTSLTVVGIFFLLQRYFNARVGLLGGLMVALDPFYMSQSRIVHLDALLASFMVLSLLALLVYLGAGYQRRYLLASGALAGLSLLTKAPALNLFPIAAFALGMDWLLSPEPSRKGGWPGKYIGGFLLWLTTAWIVFFLLWPAAWISPLEMVGRSFIASQWGVVTPHGSNFFLGRAMEGPTPWYYAVILPLRLTPLSTLFPLLSILSIKGARGDIGSSRKKGLIFLTICGGYIFLFLLVMSLSAKQGERYILPIFLVVDILAALGLSSVLDRFCSWVERRFRRSARLSEYHGLAAVLLLLFSLSWLRLAPYYGAYFNPLFGGGTAAARAFPFGQGEGLDLAANHLNASEGAEGLAIASFYPKEMGYYFRGRVTSLRRGEWDKTWLFVDYVVFYISQVQRNLPTKELVDFFLARQPEFVARINGIDYARVYKTPLLLSGQEPKVQRRMNVDLAQSVLLSGYDLNATTLRAGENLELTLHWQAQELLGTTYWVVVQLWDDAGNLVLEERGEPYEGFWPSGLWPVGKTMYDRHQIALPLTLGTGRYRLWVGMYDPVTQEPLLPVEAEGNGEQGLVPLDGIWVVAR